MLGYDATNGMTWVAQSATGDNNYVDSVALAVANDNLTITLGRAGLNNLTNTRCAAGAIVGRRSVVDGGRGHKLLRWHDD